MSHFKKKFYVADTHFLHERLLSMQPRPFLSIEEHDEHLITCWNSVVGEQDIVYHLGDVGFALARNGDRMREIFNRLKGQKFLVLGNHDLDKRGNLHPTLATLEWAAPPTHALRTKDGGRDVYMSHYAGRTWPSQHHGAVHFYGHSHGRLEGFGLSRDVGVDVEDVDFTPRTFAELTKGMDL
jgi:calcineurin-like phosphoesterase family protein